MPQFDRAALDNGAKKPDVLGLAMYDFADSGYTIAILTAPGPA